ncbi:MAG: hypothetical protein ABI832_15055 [bacterium]
MAGVMMSCLNRLDGSPVLLTYFTSNSMVILRCSIGIPSFAFRFPYTLFNEEFVTKFHQCCHATWEWLLCTDRSVGQSGRFRAGGWMDFAERRHLAKWADGPDIRDMPAENGAPVEFWCRQDTSSAGRSCRLTLPLQEAVEVVSR